jgi:hypothetical protein
MHPNDAPKTLFWRRGRSPERDHLPLTRLLMRRRTARVGDDQFVILGGDSVQRSVSANVGDRLG